MDIIFFAHPDFLDQQSMPRFAKMLAEGMAGRGHRVRIVSPEPVCYKLPVPAGLRKWLGYIDQFVIFPIRVHKILMRCPVSTLFVFCDQALGPWVPLVRHRPHVIHCHDFLAQRSALGEVPENKVAWPGRQYQRLIRWGYRQGRNFISVSLKTQTDLHFFLQQPPKLSEVVYNGMNQNFRPMELAMARRRTGELAKADVSAGYLMHIGGNNWYKNRIGVIELYKAWRDMSRKRLPLLMVGSPPSPELEEARRQSEYNCDILFLPGVDDEGVRWAYAGATMLLFPSLAEGFGWPIAEAMASGCPVVTTGKAPMTEVAGNSAFFIPPMPPQHELRQQWASAAAKVINHVAELSQAERAKVVGAGVENTKRFATESAIAQIEDLYIAALASATQDNTINV